eukprot:m.225510 g.225510  ORF g.225510 m.225510 type:complete len:195 (+) comp33462_c0_seq1:257-841(+)
MKNGLHARPLRCEDTEQMQALHEDWFPIRYPQQFFDTACAINSIFYSDCLCDVNDTLAAMIVARKLTLSGCEELDRDILPSFGTRQDPRLVLYILTIGVAGHFRRQGLGALLIGKLVKHARSSYQGNVRAIYLHVLTTNEAAISFYERLGFVRHKLLEGYYTIDGAPADAYTYILRVRAHTDEWAVCFNKCSIC